MYKYIWLVPLLPLAGAAINGIFGRWFRFPEKLIGGIAVGTVALSFLISLAAVYSYGFSGNSLWPNPYVTTQTAFTWIPGGAVKQTLGNAQGGQSTTISIANQPVTIRIRWSGALVSPEGGPHPLAGFRDIDRRRWVLVGDVSFLSSSATAVALALPGGVASWLMNLHKSQMQRGTKRVTSMHAQWPGSAWAW